MNVHLPDLPLPIKVELVDDDGYALPRRLKNGQEIVEATVGTQFRIRLENPNMPGVIEAQIPRIYLIASVDGINVGNLQPTYWHATPVNQGFFWTTDSGEPSQIDYLQGWLLDKEKLQKFKFTPRQSSFLAQRFPQLFEDHKEDWCGKIEIAFHVERLGPAHHKSRGNIGVGGGEVISNPYEYTSSEFQFRDPSKKNPCGVALIHYKLKES